MQTKIDNFVQQVNTSCALADTDLLVYVLSSDRRIKTGRIVKRVSYPAIYCFTSFRDLDK